MRAASSNYEFLKTMSAIATVNQKKGQK